jgi:hypothetical protein
LIAEEDNKYLVFSETYAELFTVGLVISGIESAALSTLIRSIYGLMNLHVKEALISSIITGITALGISSTINVIPVWFSYMLGVHIDYKKYREMYPDRPRFSFFQWKNRKVWSFCI